MKKAFTCALAVILTGLASSADAASLGINRREVGENAVFSIFLNELSQNDQVTAIEVTLTPGDSQFLNYNGTGFDGTDQLDETDDASFTSAGLTLPAIPFNGKGWTVIDGSPVVSPPSGPDGIGYAASNPGFFLDADGLLLNNIMLPKSALGAAVVVLIGGDGNPIDGGRLTDVLPEPTTLVLAGMSLIGIVGVRRRS